MNNVLLNHEESINILFMKISLSFIIMKISAFQILQRKNGCIAAPSQNYEDWTLSSYCTTGTTDITSKISTFIFPKYAIILIIFTFWKCIKVQQHNTRCLKAGIYFKFRLLCKKKFPFPKKCLKNLISRIWAEPMIE